MRRPILLAAALVLLLAAGCRTVAPVPPEPAPAPVAVPVTTMVRPYWSGISSGAQRCVATFTA